MTEPTLKQWKRRALAAQEELATIQRMRSMDAAREMEMARENAALQALDPPVEQPHLQFTAYHTDDTQAGTL